MPLRRAVVLVVWAAILTPAAGVALRLRPSEKRCLYLSLVAGESAVAEVFVQSGGSLAVHLKVEGPFHVREDGTPSLDESVEVLFSETVSSLASPDADVEDFASPALFEIDAAMEAEAVYRACVSNSVSRFSEKVVLLDLRSTSGPIRADVDGLNAVAPIALETPPHSAEASEEESQLATARRAADVAALSQRVVALRKELVTLRTKQLRERHRLAHHKSLNDNQHLEMVGASLVETVVYMTSSLFQICFVRQWFAGKGVSKLLKANDHNV